MSIPDYLQRYEPLLMTTRWFARLPERTQKNMLAAAVVKDIPAGKPFFSQGELGDGLYCVLRGGVTIGAIGPNGKEAVYVRFERPYWFGETALIDGEPHAVSGVAHVATTFLMVPKAAFNDMAKEDPEIWRHLGVLAVEKSRALFKKYEELITLPASARVAKRLLDIADGHGAYLVVPQRIVNINQKQLGAKLALTRQSVSEILKDFESRGLIRRSYGAIELLDWEQLCREGNID
jgi:CRP-like cAMP-binding protein